MLTNSNRSFFLHIPSHTHGHVTDYGSYIPISSYTIKTMSSLAQYPLSNKDGFGTHAFIDEVKIYIDDIHPCLATLTHCLGSLVEQIKIIDTTLIDQKIVEVLQYDFAATIQSVRFDSDSNSNAIKIEMNARNMSYEYKVYQENTFTGNFSAYIEPITT